MKAAFGLRADFFAFGLAALFREAVFLAVFVAVFVAFFAAVFFAAFFTLFFALFLAICSPLESSSYGA
jgi:hypothetical protein